MTENASLTLSVICPVYNEEKYIHKIVDFFLQSKPAEKEIIFADGGSTDKTREIISSYAGKHKNIVLILNEKKYVSYGLNLCIQHARGAFIARIDAHTIYPLDYFENCFRVYKSVEAANIGGSVRSAGTNDKSKAIALAMSSIAGVGNSGFRTNTADEFTDTVPFGFWHRSLFDKIGLFDTEMKRNQDDEFNFRTVANGFKIYRSSIISSTYYVRDSFAKLFRQYYEYGYYKPLVFKKTNAGYRLRHFIPTAFILYLLMMITLGFWQPVLILPLILYFILIIIIGLSKTGNILQLLYFVYSCLILHISYGAGFIAGFFKWII